MTKIKADVYTETHKTTNSKGELVKELHYLTISIGDKEVVINVGEKTVNSIKELSKK